MRGDVQKDGFEAGLIDRLDDLACRVDRLIVHHRDPERFFSDRADIVDDLRRLIADCQSRNTKPAACLPLLPFPRPL